MHPFQPRISPSNPESPTSAKTLDTFVVAPHRPMSIERRRAPGSGNNALTLTTPNTLDRTEAYRGEFGSRGAPSGPRRSLRSRTCALNGTRSPRQPPKTLRRGLRTAVARPRTGATRASWPYVSRPCRSVAPGARNAAPFAGYASGFQVDGFHADRAPRADCRAGAEPLEPAERDAVGSRALENPKIGAEQPAREQG